MLEHVTIRYERILPHTLDAAYEWLTDYSDDDPSLTDAVIEERPVRERTENRIVLEGTLRILGQRSRGVAEVRLHPPDRWVATFQEGAGRGSRYEYRLEPLEAGCRLVVDYHVRTRRVSSWLKVSLLKPAIRRELDRMWVGFAESMRRDLARVPTGR